MIFGHIGNSSCLYYPVTTPPAISEIFDNRPQCLKVSIQDKFLYKYVERPLIYAERELHYNFILIFGWYTKYTKCRYFFIRGCEVKLNDIFLDN